MRVVRLRDVAAEAGVSIATASRAMDPRSTKVSDAVRARVQETAKRLGYRPNSSARATTTGMSSIVAVLVSDIRDPCNAAIARGALEAAGQAGLMATITSTEAYVDDEARVVRMQRSMRPRAMILCGSPIGSALSRASLREELKRYQLDGGRVVVAGDAELPFETVVVRRRQGAAELAQTLAHQGYRNFGLIRPAAELAGAAEWEAGIRDGLRANGLTIDIDRIAEAPMTRDGGYQATGRLLASNDQLDVVVAATDMMAVGALAALRNSGREPGRDVGVAGFEDVVDADSLTLRLTSVDLALDAIGASAVQLAIAPAGRAERLPEFIPRVVLRESTPSHRST